METLTGTTWPVFVGLTVAVIGSAACATGRALADNWRPIRQLWFYILLLGCLDRFLAFALFDAELLMPTGYAVDTTTLLAIGWASYRLTRAHRLASQYPWIYERVGLFRLRKRDGPDARSK